MGSILLDGTSDSISRSANLPTFTGLTMAGWVKLGASTAGTVRYICAAGVNGGHQCALVRWSDNAWVVVSGGFIGNALTVAPSEGSWIYVAMRHNSTTGGTVRWYDSTGVLGGSDNGGADISTGTISGLAVGARAYYNDSAYIGKYAYWKAWDAELSWAEIEAEIFSPTFVRTTNANCGFADSSTDIGPNGRNWTLTGTGTDSDTPPVILSYAAPKSLGLLLRGCG